MGNDVLSIRTSGIVVISTVTVMGQAPTATKKKSAGSSVKVREGWVMGVFVVGMVGWGLLF